MPRVIDAFAQFFDEGVPISNGWLKFFYTGTNNTLKHTYADSDMTILNSNPLQLDANGRCPNAFGTGLYRVDLYSNDPVLHIPSTLIQTFDPIQSDYVSVGAESYFSEWSATSTYQPGGLVIYNGSYYRSIISDNNGNQPDTITSAWEQIDFLRYWNPDVVYALNEIAIYNTQIYFSQAGTNSGNQPDISPAWWTPVGSGTVLTNWLESGTAFIPDSTGYNLGSSSNHIGTAFLESLGLFPTTPSSTPSADYEVSNKKYVDDSDAESVHWKGEWSYGTYEENDLVSDENWTMVANKQTDDRAAPRLSGYPEWVDDVIGSVSFIDSDQSASALYVGQRLNLPQAYLVTSVRVWVPSGVIGADIKVFAVLDPEGTPKFYDLFSMSDISSSTVNNWIELPFSQLFVEENSTLDVIMLIRIPSEAATFTYGWTYSKTDGDPPAGSIYHQSGFNSNQIRIHEQDSSFVERSSYLDNLKAGSKIRMDSELVTWDIIDISKTGDVYTLIVNPNVHADGGASDFTFTYYGLSNIDFVYDPDYYLSDSRFDGYFSVEYDGSQVSYLDDNGYGVDVKFQTVVVSDDWDVVSHPPAGSSVIREAEPDLIYWRENSEHLEPITSGVGSLGNTTKLIENIYLGDSGKVLMGDSQDSSMEFDGSDIALISSGGLTLNGEDIKLDDNTMEISTTISDLSFSGTFSYRTVDVNATGVTAALYTASDGNLEEADASSTTTMPCTALALESGTGSKKILNNGYVRNDTWAWTPGGLIYASTTAGGLTQTAPSGTGDLVQIVGHAVSASVIYFRPEFTMVEVS